MTNIALEDLSVDEILERVAAAGATHVTVDIDGNVTVMPVAEASTVFMELPMGVEMELISAHWDMEQAERAGKEYSAPMGSFQVSKDDLAKLAAQVIATLGFHDEWNSQTFDALVTSIEVCGINPTDLGQVRELCDLMRMNPKSYGDVAPQPKFAGRGCPGFGTELESKIRKQLTKRADGERAGDPEDIDEANAELVRLMSEYAGIKL